MAENITSLELNGIKYALGKSIYAELDLSLERFVELLGRDFYCPTLNSAPTSTTKTYIDTDDSVNTFQIGQPCRWKESDGTYRLAVLADMTSSSATWYKLPNKVSELINDAGYLTSHQDISHLATKTELEKKQDEISDLDEIRTKAKSALQEVPAEYVTESELEGKGYATENQVAEVKKEVNQYTDEKVAALVNGAPETLDTLGELASALKDNKDIVDVLNASIGNKQDKIEDLETIRQDAAKGATALPLSGGTINGQLDINRNITALGNVGIGTTNPIHKLHVKASTDAPIYVEQNYSSAWTAAMSAFNGSLVAGQHYNIEIGYSETKYNQAWVGYYHDGVGSNNNRLSMGLHSVDDVFNITALGNVGIDTTSPSEKLHVNGNIKVENGSFIGNLTGTATKATQDGNGKVIADTYAVKDEVLGYDDVGGSVEDAVEYLTTSEQNLSDAEKERVKTNIGVNVPIIDHGTNDSTFSLTPNKYHRWGTMSSLSISLAPASDNTVVSNYGFEFTSGATPTSFSYPSDVQFIHEIKIETNKRYQGIISNGMGVLVSVNKL